MALENNVKELVEIFFLINLAVLAGIVRLEEA